MASAKTTAPSIAAEQAAALQLPEGYTPAFTRVEMQPGVRLDDGLCCIAMLTAQPLAEVTEMAHKLGFPRHGPAWIDNDLVRRLLSHFGLQGSEDKEVASIDALPYVAMIAVNFDPVLDFGRWALFHHVKSNEKHTSVSVIYDPAHWVDTTQHITRDFKRLITPKYPIYYIEVTPKPVGKGKAK